MIIFRKQNILVMTNIFSQIIENKNPEMKIKKINKKKYSDFINEFLKTEIYYKAI